MRYQHSCVQRSFRSCLDTQEALALCRVIRHVCKLYFVSVEYFRVDSRENRRRRAVMLLMPGRELAVATVESTDGHSRCKHFTILPGIEERCDAKQFALCQLDIFS